MTARNMLQIVLGLAFLFLPQEPVLGRSPEASLRLQETIPLPGVKGRIDHLAIDEQGQRLFIAALGSNSLEVVDLRRGIRIKGIKGLNEPQGVVYDPKRRRIYVSNGGDGTVRIFDADTFLPAGVVSFSGDADNLRFDEQTGRLYVGYGSGGLAIVDVRTSTPAGDVTLSGHPEGFALEKGGARIFVNIPAGKRIAVVDSLKQKAAADWPAACGGNFPLTLDDAHHVLFVGCRVPPQVIVYDTQTGRDTEVLQIDGDVDGLSYDAPQKSLYASCGSGSVIVFARDRSGQYRRVAAVKTRAGARTSLLVPEMHRLYVAAPQVGTTPAGILVYDIAP